jgi:hypothetical protein
VALPRITREQDKECYMTTSYFEEPPAHANQSPSVHIAERDGQRFIIIRQPNIASASIEQTFEVPATALDELKRALDTLKENFDATSEADEAIIEQRPIEFAHPSEEEFARILDFYQIAWQYEPRTFAVEWDDEGNFVSSFTPDFYLPQHDLYIELTTLKQKLVTAKNRKVRLLRQNYPDVNIKVLYRSDYRKLIEKFAASGAWVELEGEREFIGVQ